MIKSAQEQKDAKFNYLYAKMLEKVGGEEIDMAFANEITRRMNVDNLFDKISDQFD